MIITTRQEACDIARAALLYLGSPSATLGTDGRAARCWTLLFRTGVRLTTEEGEQWIPATELQYMDPGTANHEQAILADAQGRARYTATNLEPLIEAAQADPVAQQACKTLAAKLDAQGDAIPSDLAVAITNGAKRRHGPNRAKRAVRDASIIRAVWHLRESGLCIYKSDAKEDGLPSACEIVAQELVNLGFPLTYSAVRKILERHTA